MPATTLANNGMSHKFKLSPGINDSEIVEVGPTLSPVDDLNQLLAFIGRRDKKNRVVMIFSNEEEDTFSCLETVIRKHDISATIILGKSAEESSKYFALPKKNLFENAECFLMEKIYDVVDNCVVVLWGSDKNVMVEVAKKLHLHSNRATVHVDVDAVVHNIQCYRGITVETKNSH